MSVDWNEVNERRISEKTQEILLYCALRKSEMTPRSFDLAKMSFGNLLNNIIDRNQKYSAIPKGMLKSLDRQDECVSECNLTQAETLAKSIVYGCVGDDLDLYPVTAERKLQRSKLRGFQACNIPEDEMTIRDRIYVIAASAKGESFTVQTLKSVYLWFNQFGFDPHQTRIYCVIWHSARPVSLNSLPLYSQFAREYRQAVKLLVDKGFLKQTCDATYEMTSKRLETQALQ